LLFNTATQDGKRVRIGFGKDPGQAGKSQALHLVRALSGFTVVGSCGLPGTRSCSASSKGSPISPMTMGSMPAAERLRCLTHT